MTAKGEFARQVRDLLAHLYDGAHLEGHPLSERLLLGLPPAASRAQALRRALLEALDQLQPAPHVPYGEREWRPYRVLFDHYVQRLPAPQIQQELAISERQYQREHARALHGLATILWNQFPRGTPPQAGGAEADAISSEVCRLIAGACHELLDAEKLIRGTAAAVEKLALSHGIRITTAFVAPLPPLFGDGGLLRQLILNVLGFLLNAATAADARAVPRKPAPGIHLAACSIDGGLHLRFALDGPQAPPLADLPAALRQRLELSEQLTRAIGGRLLLQGRTVELWLPSYEKTLLVIDDNQELIHLFERFLPGGRYKVAGAQAGEQALALAREIRPFLITLDVMMPTHDGWEVLQNLKHNPETQHIPVAICSILSEAELAFSLGADDYIRKPVTQHDLLALLARWDKPG